MFILGTLCCFSLCSLVLSGWNDDYDININNNNNNNNNNFNNYNNNNNNWNTYGIQPFPISPMPKKFKHNWYYNYDNFIPHGKAQLHDNVIPYSKVQLWQRHALW